MTDPALTRLTLSPTNAAGLARSKATSIWSRDTLAGFVAAAILLAVSPDLTVTCPVPLRSALATAGREGILAILVRGSAGMLTEDGVGICAGLGAAGVAWRNTGGSNNMV